MYLIYYTQFPGCTQETQRRVERFGIFRLRRVIFPFRFGLNMV